MNFTVRINTPSLGVEHIPDCKDYIWIDFLWFEFHWFLDCGEWFIYVGFNTKKRHIGYRFSSAGNMSYNFMK